MNQSAYIKKSTSNESQLRIQPSDFEELCKQIENHSGIRLRKDRQREVEQKLFSDRMDSVDINICSVLNAAQGCGDSIQRLINRLTIGESYFFRNRPHFDALVEEVIPAIIERARPDRSMRIWCLGCACGEEPYSLAILLREQFRETKKWDVNILATDINTTFLDRAVNATYSKWSLRTLDKNLLARYFDAESRSRYRLKSNVLHPISFRWHNLMDFPYTQVEKPASFDLILCRNVLIYFAFDTANRVVKELREMLRAKSFLFVGHSEAYPTLGNLKVCISKATYYYQRVDKADYSEPPRLSRFPLPGTGIESIAPPPLDSLPEFHLSSTDKTSKPNENPAQLELSNPSTIQQDPLIVESVDRVSEQSADSIAIELEEAKLFADQGNTKKAHSLLCSLLKGRGKLDYRVHFLSALVADQMNEFDRAIDHLKHAIFLNKKLIVAHFLLGVLYERDGSVKAAKKFFQNALQLLSPLPDEQRVEESRDLYAGHLRDIVQARIYEINLSNDSIAK